MSRIRADKFVNNAATGAPQLTFGAEIPVGVGLTGAGDINVGGAATIGGSLSVGGTLTYEDVTNIDSVGLITARSGIEVTGGGINVSSGIVTATSFVGSGASLTGIESWNQFDTWLYGGG